MSDETNIHQFPGTSESNGISKDNIFLQKIPDDLKDSTEMYELLTVQTSREGLKKVPDMLNGGFRNHRWGAAFAFTITPSLDQNDPGEPAVLPVIPNRYFSADSLEDLKKRVVFEIDKMIEAAQLAASDPQKFEKYLDEYHSYQMQGMQEAAASEAGQS